VRADYEIFFKAPMMWRIHIRGPFHVEIATIIINGERTFIFAEDNWRLGNWDSLSSQYFGAVIAPETLNLMLGMRYGFRGLCSEVKNYKVCRRDNVYFAVDGEDVSEVQTYSLNLVREDSSWKGSGKHNSFEISPESIEVREGLEDSLFLPVIEEDPFGDI